MAKYGLHGKLTATSAEGADQLANILLEASELVSTAKGCQLYIVSRDATDSLSVWVTEIWDTAADHEASLTVPGVRELISQAIPLLAGRPERGQELEILGGFQK